MVKATGRNGNYKIVQEGTDKPKPSKPKHNAIKLTGNLLENGLPFTQVFKTKARAEQWLIENAESIELDQIQPIDATSASTSPATNMVLIMKTSNGVRRFLMPYQPKHGGNPTHLRHTINGFPPIMQAWEEEGKRWAVETYTSWQGDIDDNITTAEEMINTYRDKKKEFPSQYYENVKKAERLKQVKQWLAADELITENLGTGIKAFTKNGERLTKDPRLIKKVLMLQGPEFIKQRAAINLTADNNITRKIFNVLGIPMQGELQIRIAKKLVANGEYKKAKQPEFSMAAYSVEEIEQLYDELINDDLVEAMYNREDDANTFVLINTKTMSKVGHGAVYANYKAAERYLDKQRKYGKAGWKTAPIEIVSIEKAESMGITSVPSFGNQAWKYPIDRV